MYKHDAELGKEVLAKVAELEQQTASASSDAAKKIITQAVIKSNKANGLRVNAPQPTKQANDAKP